MGGYQLSASRLMFLLLASITKLQQISVTTAFCLTTHPHHQDHRCVHVSYSDGDGGTLKIPSNAPAATNQPRRALRFFTGDSRSSSTCCHYSSSSRLYLYSLNNEDSEQDGPSQAAAAEQPLVLFGSEDDDEEDMSQEEQLLLSYLPNNGRNIPPQFRQLVVQATQQYVYGKVLSNNDGDSTTAPPPPPLFSLQDMAAIIELEHFSRDVPVQIDQENNVVADVTTTGEELDEICAELLSAAALYELPQEITLELLRAPVRETAASSATTSALNGSSVIGDSSLVACQAAFCETGWSRVVFPRGLAVTPHRKFRRSSNNKVNKKLMTFSWRPSVRRKRAAQAVAAAEQRQPPPRRRPLDRQEFLQSVQAQLEAEQKDDYYDEQSITASILLDGGSSSIPESSLTFFPQQSPYSSFRARLAHQLSLRNFNRLVRKQYTALKKQGRAGLVAYCFFNFAYYTAGMLWQWPRVPIAASAATTTTSTVAAGAGADAAMSAVSATALLWRKAAKVYAYLYAASQIFKLPKLIVSVAAAPVAARLLQFCRQRLRMRNDTYAAALLIAVLMLTWLALAGVLVGQDFALLQQNGGQLLQQQQPSSFNPLLYHDRLLQIYGKVQPV